MSLGQYFVALFEKIPEWPIKNNLRYFLAFNKIIPKIISEISPIKGYIKYYLPKKGDIIIDAGAYPGDYAVFASRMIGKTGKIICFEPDPKNRKILKRNLQRQGLNNFVIVPKGLWSKNTFLNLNVSDGLHSSLSSEQGLHKIEVVKLDDELKKLSISKINFIKMDIEGAEIEAIKGMKDLLRKQNPSVAIASYHIVNGKTTSEYIEKFLRKLSYHSESDFPKHLTTYAWKKS